MTILRMTEEEWNAARGVTTGDAESSRTAASDPANPRLVQDRLFDLRDYFAANALIACMSAPRWLNGLDLVATKTGTPMKEALAEMVYQYADAMLKERDKGTP